MREKDKQLFVGMTLATRPDGQAVFRPDGKLGKSYFMESDDQRKMIMTVEARVNRWLFVLIGLACALPAAGLAFGRGGGDFVTFFVIVVIAMVPPTAFWALWARRQYRALINELQLKEA